MADEPYDLEKVRKEHIGLETEPVQGRYPVEYDPIRRHCHMVGDTNPLFLDPEYARKTRYGECIVPPPQVVYFAGQGTWPPAETPALPPVPTIGNRAINLTVETEWLKPVKVGDRLSLKHRIADIQIKPIRLDPLAVWTTTERIITNQDGELVCVERSFGLRHRTPEEVAAKKGEPVRGYEPQ